MNEKNLIPLNKQDKDTAKKIQSAGGIACQKKRKEQKLFREIFKELLNLDIDKFTNNEEILSKIAEINPIFAEKIDVKTVIAARVLKSAINGDLAAFSNIRDIIGELITNKVETVNANVEITDKKIVDSVIEKIKDL